MPRSRWGALTADAIYAKIIEKNPPIAGESVGGGENKPLATPPASKPDRQPAQPITVPAGWLYFDRN